jgi:hypothetical protein
MQDLLNLIRWMLLGLFRSKTSLEAEILALRYSKTRIKRSKDVRAGRLGALRRSTFNWCRSAITSPSSELLDRKRSRRIHLSRLKISSTRRSSPDSGAQAKRMGFAVGTGIVGESIRLGPELGQGATTYMYSDASPSATA